MVLIEITDLEADALKPYRALTDSALKLAAEEQLLIAESPKVINTALDAGLQPVSLLCEKKHISGDASRIIERCPDLTVYTGSRELLNSLTGYKLTRGVLCAMKRPTLPTARDLLGKSKRICVIYDVCDTTNIGAIFRTAAALGVDGVLLSPQTCDPFNRRSIRVSMGTVFQIPWCFEPDVIAALRKAGFKSVSMALSSESIFLQDFKVEKETKYAVIFGSEGYGLPQSVIDGSDYVVKIPMHHNVDSLNVAASAAITLWHFTA